jgi:hypothetical protein
MKILLALKINSKHGDRNLINGLYDLGNAHLEHYLLTETKIT